MKKYLIVPSILAADEARLGEEVQSVVEAGADWIHIDVMDNHYVPNLAFGPQICGALRGFGIKAPLEVHLAVKPVDNLIAVFAKSGADIITFHPEATEDLNFSLNLIHEHGIKAGLSFHPQISLDFLASINHHVDLISILGVNPGFGGQTFIPSSLEKIRHARQWIAGKDYPIRLGVDGGINLTNIKELANAGADTFMMGTSIFTKKDYHAILKSFREMLELPYLESSLESSY